MRAEDRSSETPPQTDLLVKALSAAANAIFIADKTGCIIWVNEAFCRLSGYTADETLGRTPAFLKSGKQDESFYRDLWHTILGGGVWRGDVVEKRKDGTLYTVEEIITPLRDDDGEVRHFVAMQHDITLRKQASEHEHFLAYHDVLTGLPNRAYFLRTLRQAIDRAQRTQQALAVSFLDLDNFKPTNDAFGHYFGDRLLVAVAERLSGAIRRTDTVARLGGDEFAILQADLPDAAIAVALAEKLLHTVAQPFVLGGKTMHVTASIGIAAYPANGVDADTLLRNADEAMYRAKDLGRNRYQFC
jgi:diguanylate cyclase